ncbi:MAG: hypothetical protein JWR81_4317, partial [Pseudonocardia sp.]|nr:hypothetical protein [Pseudonocardia sp.]
MPRADPNAVRAPGGGGIDERIGGGYGC